VADVNDANSGVFDQASVDGKIAEEAVDSICLDDGGVVRDPRRGMVPDVVQDGVWAAEVGIGSFF